MPQYEEIMNIYNSYNRDKKYYIDQNQPEAPKFQILQLKAPQYKHICHLLIKAPEAPEIPKFINELTAPEMPEFNKTINAPQMPKILQRQNYQNQMEEPSINLNLQKPKFSKIRVNPKEPKEINIDFNVNPPQESNINLDIKQPHSVHIKDQNNKPTKKVLKFGGTIQFPFKNQLKKQNVSFDNKMFNSLANRHHHHQRTKNNNTNQNNDMIVGSSLSQLKKELKENQEKTEQKITDKNSNVKKHNEEIPKQE